MSNFNILALLYLALMCSVSWGEDTSKNQIIEELNKPEFNPILSLPPDSSVRPELKAIQSEIKNIKADSPSCSKKIFSSIKNLTSNRGLLDSVHFYTGLCKEIEGDFESAIEEYKTSLKLKRSNKEAILRLAYLSAINKDYTNSLNLSEEVIWLDYKPQDLPLYIKAVSQKELKNIKEAQASLDKLDGLNSSFPPSLVLRKNLILLEIDQTQDPSKAKILRDSYNKLLPKLVALDPENKTYALEYGKILLASGHPINSPNILKQGLSLARKFSRTPDNKINETFLLLEIQFLEKQGKSSEALEILNNLAKAKALGPSTEYKRQEISNKLSPSSEKEE